MKKIIYVCDKCNKEFKRTEVVQYAGQVSDCGELRKETLELCKVCDNELRSLFDTFLSRKKVVDTNNDSKQIVQDKVNSQVVQGKSGDKQKAVEGEYKKGGALSSSETDMMLHMYEEGKTPEEIAARLNRSVRGINRAITCALRKKEREHTVLEEKKTETVKEESDLSAEGNKYDIPGILALARAGWTPRQIAGEHHCKVDEITEILSTYRKK